MTSDDCVVVHFDLKLFDRAANNALCSNNASVYHWAANNALCSNNSVYHAWERLLQQHCSHTLLEQHYKLDALV